MRRYARQEGFTLAELLTVVGAWAIFAAAAVPVASTIVSHHRMQAATRELAFEIARARMQAVGQNTFVRIVLIGSDGYVRQRSADGVTYVADGAPVRLPPGVTLAAGPTGTPGFDRQGLAPASTTLTLSGSAGQRTLSTTVLGRVEIG